MRSKGRAQGSVFPSAFADGTRPDTPLPTSLNAWEDASAEVDLRDLDSLSLSAFPQGKTRRVESHPFADFSKMEFGGFAGVVGYSSDFEARPSYVFGITTRLPLPGMPLGEWGAFAQVFLGYINRDIPFYYSRKEGNWYGVGVGADYTFIKGDIFFLRAQLGVMYAQWNNIQALDNGMGILIGAEAGFFWIRNYNKASVIFCPQLSYDGTNYIGMFTFGFKF